MTPHGAITRAWPAWNTIQNQRLADPFPNLISGSRLVLPADQRNSNHNSQKCQMTDASLTIVIITTAQRDVEEEIGNREPTVQHQREFISMTSDFRRRCQNWYLSAYSPIYPQDTCTFSAVWSVNLGRGLSIRTSTIRSNLKRFSN